MDEFKKASCKALLGEIKQVLVEICQRTRAAICNIRIFVGACCIILFGGLGIWREIIFAWWAPEGDGWDVKYGDAISAAITFYPALIVLACMQLIVLRKRNDDVVHIFFNEDVVRIFFFLVLLIALQILSLLFFFEYTGQFPVISAAIALCFSIIGILLWGLSNDNHPDFEPEKYDDEALGGAHKSDLVDVALGGGEQREHDLLGDLEGLKT